jgi:hypothetical protein
VIASSKSSILPNWSKRMDTVIFNIVHQLP